MSSPSPRRLVFTLLLSCALLLALHLVLAGCPSDWPKDDDGDDTTSDDDTFWPDDDDSAADDDSAT